MIWIIIYLVIGVIVDQAMETRAVQGILRQQERMHRDFPSFIMTTLFWPAVLVMIVFLWGTGHDL